MRRGTTPTLTFTTEYAAADIAACYVTFEQRGAVVLEKAMGDSGITVSDNLITVNLTQEETLAMTTVDTCKAQIRIVLTNGNAVASNIVQFCVCPVLKDGEI